MELTITNIVGAGITLGTTQNHVRKRQIVETAHSWRRSPKFLLASSQRGLGSSMPRLVLVASLLVTIGVISPVGGGAYLLALRMDARIDDAREVKGLPAGGVWPGSSPAVRGRSLGMCAGPGPAGDEGPAEPRLLSACVGV